MAITTYISAADLAVRFADTDYTAAQRTEALEGSFGLVNSYISAEVRIPAIGPDGTVPEVLKHIQWKFYMYILQTMNQGHTEELTELFNETVEMCRQIQQNDLIVNEVQVTESQIGWNLLEGTSTDGLVYIKGTPPVLETEYVVTATSANDSYTADATFSVTRSDLAAAVATLTGSREWQPVDGNFSIRFDGKFDLGDTWTIKGIPDNLDKIQKQSSVFKTVSLIY